MKAKKGQISIEVIYSIGVMLIIFLILTGVSFSWRLQFMHTDEYIDQRNQCFKIADYISGVAIGGHGTSARIYVREQSEVYSNGVIVVGTTSAGPGEVEATCGFSAPMKDPKTTLQALNYYTIMNVNSNITIT